MKRMAAAIWLAASICSAHAQQAYLPDDANKDGYDSPAELTAWYRAHIAALDSNGDGVDRTEFSVLYESQVKDGSFAKVDLDKNGRLTGKEITAMAVIIARSDMAFCDANKDGKISLAESRRCTSGALNK